MNRAGRPRTLQILLVWTLLMGAPARHAFANEGAGGEEASMEEYLEMEAASQAFRAVADSFVVAAANGDAATVAALISPNLRAQAGEEAVANVVTGQVLPFFAAYGAIGNSVTITQTSDQFGNAGYAYYMWMVPKSDGETAASGETAGAETSSDAVEAEPRPFVLYVLQEGDTIVIGNVLVDYYVEGRHQ